MLWTPISVNSTLSISPSSPGSVPAGSHSTLLYLSSQQGADTDSVRSLLPKKHGGFQLKPVSQALGGQHRRTAAVQIRGQAGLRKSVSLPAPFSSESMRVHVCACTCVHARTHALTQARKPALSSSIPSLLFLSPLPLLTRDSSSSCCWISPIPTPAPN